jgi:hypothetical protein
VQAINVLPPRATAPQTVPFFQTAFHQFLMTELTQAGYRVTEGGIGDFVLDANVLWVRGTAPLRTTHLSMQPSRATQIGAAGLAGAGGGVAIEAIAHASGATLGPFYATAALLGGVAGVVVADAVLPNPTPSRIEVMVSVSLSQGPPGASVMIFRKSGVYYIVESDLPLYQQRNLVPEVRLVRQ